MAERKPGLSAQLRRSADRPAIRGARPTERLILAAESGLLTKYNTKEGSRGRQAVDRVTYLRRKAKRPDMPARAALGHEPSEVRTGRSISVLLDRPDPFVILEGATRREASRAGKYDSLVGKLYRFEMSPKQFERRISGWRPIRGERFLADPNRVLAVLEARRAGELDLFVYESGRSS